MIPAWTVSIAAFLALLMKYYGYDFPEVIRHRARMKKRKSLDFWKSKQITEKEWMLVLKYLGIPSKTIEPFVHSVRISGNPNGYVAFIFPALIFLLVSFSVPYLYGLLFSLLSGVFFFICIRMVLGPKRTWKLTVRTHDSDRYLIPWSELKNAR